MARSPLKGIAAMLGAAVRDPKRLLRWASTAATEARTGGVEAVRRKMRLKLIVHLVRKETMDRDFERLPYEPLSEDILEVPVRKTVIAVDAGRNLAVLVEAAVRNTILQLRGIDTYAEFIERHHRAMGKAD